MFGYTLNDFEVKPLDQIFEYELSLFPNAARESLWQALDITFGLWKNECAKREEVSLNSLNALLRGAQPVSDEEFEKAEPWQCAGFGVRCRTELAFKLWTDNYERFKKITDQMGVLPVFALLASRENPMYAPAIIRTAGMLAGIRYELFIDHLVSTKRKEQKMQQVLAAGRRKGASVLKAKAEQTRRAMRDFARSYFMQNPAHTYDDVIQILLTKNYSQRPGGGKYSARTIEGVIRGIKDEALAGISKGARA